MSELLLVIHILIALALIGIVMIQRNEGGGLGIGGGSGGGGMGGFMTGRGTANLLTRATAILAALFMISSLVLVILMNSRQPGGSLVDQLRDSGTPGITEPAPQSDPAPGVE